VLVGELHAPGETDIVGRRQDFGRVQAVGFSETTALEAVQLQQELLADGEQLAARDMMIAATARTADDHLVVADSDFQTDSLESSLRVTNLRAD
jgi:predicted nucleic acid-binding protein